MRHTMNNIPKPTVSAIFVSVLLSLRVFVSDMTDNSLDDLFADVSAVVCGGDVVISGVFIVVDVFGGAVLVMTGRVVVGLFSPTIFTGLSIC